MDPVVLHVLESLEGGTARHVTDVTRFVDGVRHEVVLPPRRVGGVTDEAAPVMIRDAGAVVHVVDMRRSPVHAANALALARMRRLVSERRPSIVHAHSSIGGVLGRLAATGHPAARVYTAHGMARGRGALAVERFLGRLTDRWIAVSASEAEFAMAHRVVAADRLVVIPNGVDLSPAARPPGPGLRDRAGVPGGVPVVGSVARLTAQKAPVEFVRVCAAIASRRPDAWFVLVGSGPMRSQVSRAAGHLGVAERFRLIDAVNDVGARLDELDVFVLTSRFEGAPYTPLEAMRAGVPVVLTDVVGNCDVIEDGRSGYLRPFGDIEGLAEACVSLLADAGRRTSMTEAARQRLSARFDVHAMASGLATLYAGVAAMRGR